jgi:hypothetical protein
MTTKYHRWQETELEYIKNNHNILSDEEIAANLSKITNKNITVAMIRRQRRKLVIKKPRGRRSKDSDVVMQEEKVGAVDET